jgi:hypothetical protein
MVFTKRLKVLSAAAVAVLVYVLATNSETGSTVTGPAQATRAQAGRAPGAAATPRNVSSTSGPDARDLLARLSHRVTDGKAAPALFHSQSWYVAPPPPPPAAYVAPPPPPAPTAPPLPFTVMGSYARPGDATIYFLTRGERVFDVRVGDTIDSTYSVDGASNGQLQLTYKPLNIQQTLALGGSQ